MSRFRPRPSRPRRLWPWGIVWAVLVVLYLMWLGWPRGSTQGATIDKAVTRSTANITISYTGLSWNHKPIYVLHNTGGTLAQINIYDLSEDHLPVLYVGFAEPANLSSISAQASPPYTLAHTESIWFVASKAPPNMFTITWDNKGQVRYTTIKVAAGI